MTGFDLRMISRVLSAVALCACSYSVMAADEDAGSSTMKVNVGEIQAGADPVASAIAHAQLDEKRSRLREQLKRDRADSKRARSIRRNLELDKNGLDPEEAALKKKMEYQRSQEGGDGSHEATDSAKKFSQWVNDNMMINKDKKKGKEKEEAPATADDLLE